MSPRKSPLVALIARDVLLTLRHGVDSLMVIVFFVLVVVLFPLGLGPEPTILARISPGVIWVAALLAAMLSMERLFQNDHSDGSLELLVLSPVPLELQFLAKTAAHWLTTGLPLIIVAPLLGIFLNMPAGGYTV
ncbi:MAG: heme exporter protein CcmB, partial [Pseudomonadota bacterium]|nr:heme exporter protein CcmB [Pseudomonadota bacterium]